MKEASLFDRVREAAEAIRACCSVAPEVGIILGSGLGELVGAVDAAATVPYDRIPHFPEPSVAGHAGRLTLGHLAGRPVAVFQGRFHHYEGHDLATVTFPVRVLRALGASDLILTAAVGGIASELVPGDLMAVSDHLNLIGANPLRGPNDERLGTRFPDMTDAHDPALRGRALAAAEALGISLKEGVYAAVPGPSYETPAEIRMLHTLGADVVGMSTVPEVIVARHEGLRVLALAVISNWAAGIAPAPITHAEVLAAGQEAAPRLARLIAAVVGAEDAAPRGGTEGAGRG